MSYKPEKVNYLCIFLKANMFVVFCSFELMCEIFIALNFLFLLDIGEIDDFIKSELSFSSESDYCKISDDPEEFYSGL